MIKPKPSLKPIERVGHPIKSRAGRVTLERNERTIDFPPEVLADLRELLTGFVLRAYPEMDELYATLASWSGYSGTELLATDGADGAIHRVFAIYVSEGDEVVTMTPTYAMYSVYCEAYRARVRHLTFDADLTLPFERVLAAATPGTRLFALVNPNQPIESCFELDQLRQLAARCREHDTLLLVDEAYHHFCEITAAPLVREFENVVVARTLSKAFGLAGLRIGYLIGSPQLIGALRILKPIYEVSHLNAAIATYLLRRPEIMTSYLAQVRAGREVLERFFTSRGCTVQGKHSNTILVGLDGLASAATVASDLAAVGWLIKAETKEPIPNHLRITIGPPDQMAQLCTLVERAFSKSAVGQAQ